MRRWLIRLLVAPVVLLVLHLMLFKHVEVPLTPLMLIRASQGHGIDQRWVKLDEISPHVARAVIAAEDNRFCEHDGVDWRAVRAVLDEYRDEGRLRGASTISMQTVKNLYLWPGRSVIRKGLETILVHLLEAAWSKERIIEVYLNIAELGPGIYGVEAAAQHHYGITAERLNLVQSAGLAATLPAPLSREPTRKNKAMGQRVRRIRSTIKQLGSRLDCVPEAPELVPRQAGQRMSGVQADEGSVTGPERTLGEATPPADGFPTHLELEDAVGEQESAPQKPRRRKKKKIRSNRRRRSR